ncbi:MAG TPA: UvrD-helicase domain-containing protein [Gemmatimonadota bacterium]
MTSPEGAVLDAADPILDPLNPAQRAAVLAVEGPVLVLAGAGSGKTRVLTHRVAYLLREGLAGERAGTGVLAVTFTNKAAREMRERIERLVPGADPRWLQVGTFHSICARLLRRAAPLLGYPPDFTIYDAEDSLAVLNPLVARHGLAGLTPRAVRARISSAKNAMLTPADLEGRARGPVEARIAEIWAAYEDALARSAAWDFDDLLRSAVAALETSPALLARERRRFGHVLVDEYQDTNRAQYRFVRLLAEEHRNLCVVGDDDQSIYAFRGADPRNILELERDFPETRTVRLEQNYRSTRTILDVAHGVVSRNAGRKPKRLWTENPAGAAVELRIAPDEREEAQDLAERILALRDEGGSAGDAAVLYRTNAQSRAIEDALRRARIPYRLVGGIRFYERREVKDALAWMRAIANPRDDLSFRRLLGAPRRGIGGKTVEALAARAAELRVSLQEAAATEGGEAGRSAPAGAAGGGARVSAAGRAARGGALREVAALLARFRDRASREPVAGFVGDLLEESGLLAWHGESGEPEAEDRVENLRELIASAREAETSGRGDLASFLEEIALLSEVDDAEFGPGAATLLTLHNAKGLEFPTVFIAGVEEGLLPLARAGEEPDDVEEERRLFYVGLTRARERVVLSCARRRARWGASEDAGGPSRFLADIPRELLAVRERRGWRSPGGPSTFERASHDTFERRGNGGGRGGGEGARDGFIPDEDVDYASVSDLAPRFTSGERVRHPRFGAGTIRRVTGLGSDLKVTVAFDDDDDGERTLVARLARLERET